MLHELRFQVLTLPNTEWSAHRRRVKRAEELGFDIVALGDHFCDWANPPAPWLEAWTLLAAFAAETDRIRLATCVAQIPLRNPGVLAHQAVTVDHISDGRLELGVGTGLTIDPGTEMIGLPNWSNRERVDRFGEYVELLALLLSQDLTDYDGTYYSAAGAVMNPSSVQNPRVPIVVAALGPKMMAHTARHADAWNTMSFDADFSVQLEEARDRSHRMDQLCLDIGRDPGSLRRSFSIFDATARAGGGRIRYYDDHGLFVDLVNELVDIGYTDISLYWPSQGDQVESFEQLAVEAFPQLRAAHDTD